MIPHKLDRARYIAKGSSGALDHFWRKEDSAVLHGVHLENRPPMKLPNSKINNKIRSDVFLFKVCYASKLKSIILSDLKNFQPHIDLAVSR